MWSGIPFLFILCLAQGCLVCVASLLWLVYWNIDPQTIQNRNMLCPSSFFFSPSVPVLNRMSEKEGTAVRKGPLGRIPTLPSSNVFSLVSWLVDSIPNRICQSQTETKGKLREFHRGFFVTNFSNERIPLYLCQ